MATPADFKNGLYLNYNGKPCVIVWFQHVKPGTGPAFVKAKLRNLENGRILENTFTAGVKIDTISVERRPYQFLYDDGEAFNFMHEVVPVMARQRGGSIINMASIAGQTGNSGQVNYSATKAGLIAMAKSVAKEMGSRGIRANSIAPGFVITEMTEVLPQAVKDEYMKLIPLRRGATVEEVANVALFLGSDLSSYVTGQVIAVNGGMYC